MNLQSLTDSELVDYLRGKKRKKDAAFTEIYSRYSSMVHGYCMVMLRNRELAEDAFQETFIKFYKSVNPASQINNIPGYLNTIARNHCLNVLRDRKPKVEIEDRTLTVDESDRVDKNEMIELIMTALELLEPIYRDAFIYKEFLGYNYAEISEKQEISYDNAKVRYLRAKQKVIKILSPYLKDLSK